MTEPIQKEYRESMELLARFLDDVLNGDVRPKRIGFALFVYEFGNTDDGRVNYISNADRNDMMVAVREWLARAEGRVVAAPGRQ